MDDRINMILVDCINANDMSSFYKLKEWKEKRIQIIKRDHYECQICKRKGKIKILRAGASNRRDRPYVHHKKHLKDFPELALSDENLETVCFDCHELEHIEERGILEKKKAGYSNKEMW